MLYLVTFIIVAFVAIMFSLVRIYEDAVLVVKYGNTKLGFVAGTVYTVGSIFKRA